MVLAWPTIRNTRKLDTELFKNPIEVTHHILVTETHDAKAMLFQQSAISLEVQFMIVRLTVDFDCQPLGRTEEIDDPIPDYFLTTELVICEPLAAQCLPQAQFRLRHLATHSGGSLEHRRSRHSTTPNPLL